MSSTQSRQDHSPGHGHGRGGGGHGGRHGLAPGARRWPMGVVLLIALGLALAVPLAGRAFGADDKPKFPGCGIAPWTGTCTCVTARNGTAMGYEDFALALRRPGAVPAGMDAEVILADARKICRIDRPVTRSAAQ